MDAITLTVAAGAYVAAALAKRVVDVPLDKAINTAFERIVSTMWAKLGHKPLPEDFNTSVVRSVDLKQNPVLINDVDSIFKTSSALRRARLVEQVLRNARLLWVDDVPDNIIYEVQVLRALGVEIETALSTDEAMGMIEKRQYDLVVSDMARHGQPDAGLQFLSRLRKSGKQTPIVYYVGAVEPSRGTPLGESRHPRSGR